MRMLRHGFRLGGGGWVYPRLRAVPMGWNWAMWINQRAHQHVALHGRGRPCPDLSDGKVILVPYADNLNVAGTCSHRVQKVKDKM